MIELAIFGVYLCVLVPLAWMSKRRSTERTPHDFYLAGGGLGFVVLLATLFATQYSGNTFLAFPGKAYRSGYPYVMSVMFMMAMVGGYLLYAPWLRAASERHRFVTPADWIHHRFGSTTLTILAALLMVWALGNYLLAQLMAMGHAVSGLTDGRVPYAAGVIFLALVILVYETVGGMRAVAWTDTLQGGLMAVAVVTLCAYLLVDAGEIAALPERLLEVAPEKVAVPEGRGLATWASTIFLVGLGGAFYPQAIQRIYAARSTEVLKRSLAVMVFLPLVATLFACFIGWLAIPRFPGLEAVASDEVMARMLAMIGEQGPLLRVAVAVLVVGVLAATMSTADSVILSLSSILVQDLYGKTLGRRVSDARMLAAGKVVSWVSVLALVGVALTPDLTLFKLLEIKFEVLLQVAPAFVLGLRDPKLPARVVLAGLLVGTAVALAGFASGGKWWGVHPGTLGRLLNFAICLLGGRLARNACVAH